MLTNVGHLLTKRAAITPHREAFVEWERNRRFTFSELNTRSNQIASVLLSQGIKPGDRVATLLKNGIEFVESYFAIAKIGAVMVPVNWRLVSVEISYILKDSAASTLLFDAEFDNTVDELQSDKRGELPCQHWLRCSRGEAETPDWAQDYDELTAKGDISEPTTGASGDDNLFIMYTSGTTGHPKGAVHSHDGMLWSQLTSMSTSDMRGDDRFLLALPMFHVGCLNPTSLLVHRGATGVIMRDLDMPGMFNCIDAEKISIFMAVPALLQFMLHAPEREQCDISSVRWIATGAAPVPVSLLDAWAKLGVSIHQAYGLTESCGPGTLLLPEDAASKVGSCGRPQMHTELKIIDARGKTIPMGSEEPGELLLAGRHMMKEYWNNPKATAEALIDGWLHTGDLCSMDARGYCTVEGRLKDMIIRGGENIYPREIEEFLYTNDKIRDVQVVGVASRKYGEEVAAFIQLKPKAHTSEEEMRAFCDGKIAFHKIPKFFMFIDEYPTTASGKIQKYKLREHAVKELAREEESKIKTA